MVDQKPSSNPGAEKRRSTRLEQRVPITVSGTDALGQEFTERTSTVAVNVHGAAFDSSHYVLRDAVLTIEVAGAKPGDAPRVAQCKVIRSHRPQKPGEPFRIAVQLDAPGNIWCVALPPKDWKPFMGEHAPEEAPPAEETAQGAAPPAIFEAGVAATTDPGAVKRRSTRIVQSVPLTVMGVNALGQQFKERTSTLIINCHGCKYASKHYVLKNSWLNLEVPHPDPGQPPRVCRARVTFVQRPRTVRELFQVGAELEVAGNLWGIAFPPPDWVPFPEDYKPTGELPPPPPPESAIPASPPEPSAPPKVRAFPTAAPADVAAALSKHIAKLVAEARVQIQQAAKETVTSSVAAETAQLLRTLNRQLEDAARRAVEGATAGFREEFHHQLAARMEEERRALLESARQQWTAEISGLLAESERTAAQSATASAAMQQSFTAALEKQLAEAQRRVEDYHRQLTVSLEEERRALVESARQQWTTEVDHLLAERERATAQSAIASSAMQESFSAALEKQLAGAQRQVEEVHQRLAAAVAALEDSLTVRIDQHISAAEERIQAAAAPVPESIAAQLQQQVEGVRGQMQELLDRMSQTAASLESSLTQRVQQGLTDAEQHLQALAAPVPETVAAALRERVADAQRQIQAAQDRLADAARSIEASLGEKLNQHVAETERRIREAAGEVPASVAAELERQRAAARDLLREFVEGLSATQESIQDAFDTGLQKQLAAAQQRLREMNAAMETQARSTQESFASSVQKHLTDADERIEKARQGLAETLDLLRGSFTQEIEQHLAGARATAAALESDLSARVEESRGKIGEVSREVEILVHTSIERLRVESEQRNQAALARIRELEESTQRMKSQFEAAAAEAQAGLRRRIDDDVAEVGANWIERLQESVAGATSRLETRLDALLQSSTQQAEHDMRSSAGAVRAEFEAQIAATQKSLAEIRATLETEMSNAQVSLAALDAAVARVAQATAEIQSAGQRATQAMERRLDEATAGHTRALAQQSDILVGSLPGRLRPILESAEKESVARAVAAIEAELSERQLRLSEQVQKQHEQILQAAQESVHGATNQLHEAMGQLQRDYERSAREMIQKWIEELEARGTDATHSTFEALYKAADWYQKKAQTSMQSALDKLVGQTTDQMREKAGEVSRLFGQEIDHYSRSYVDHAQSQMEESARELTERNQARIQQTADATLAAFSDDVHRVAQGKLGEFGQSAEAKAADLRGQMDTAARETAEEFGHSLNRRLEDQIAAARQSLEKTFQQVFAQWQAQRDARSQEWQQVLTRLAGESVEQYKQRLENTSNSWIVAAATNFNQQGQLLLESFARNADERLRSACAGVFSGLADAMRDRLLNLSTELTRKPEDEKK